MSCVHYVGTEWVWNTHAHTRIAGKVYINKSMFIRILVPVKYDSCIREKCAFFLFSSTNRPTLVCIQRERTNLRHDIIPYVCAGCVCRQGCSVARWDTLRWRFGQTVSADDNAKVITWCTFCTQSGDEGSARCQWW